MYYFILSIDLNGKMLKLTLADDIPHAHTCIIQVSGYLWMLMWMPNCPYRLWGQKWTTTDRYGHLHISAASIHPSSTAYP